MTKPRRYYSSRTSNRSLSVEELYWKLRNLYLFFRKNNYFRQKAGITENYVPDSIEHKAAIVLSFQPFPITKWPDFQITEDCIFDVIEFLYDHASKPGAWSVVTSPSGDDYYDYESYDEEAGQDEFRSSANSFLTDYKTGFELTKEGTILAIGEHGLQNILVAEIIPYDEANVDKKVRSAIAKWRNRHLALSEKKEAIRELADVFEWLKKTKKLSAVLDAKDESAIFDIANNFALRHHNPNQKTNYDKTI